MPWSLPCSTVTKSSWARVWRSRAIEPTPQQMAEALSTASGQPVGYRQIGMDEVAARSDDLAAMYRFLEQTGYQVDVSALRVRFPEVSWTTFAAWAYSSVSSYDAGTDRTGR